MSRPRRASPPARCARRASYRGTDAYGRRAKAAGYRARSALKIEEIDRRVGLLRPGQRVLDLGAAPGSWSQYAAWRVGPAGRVLAVDLAPIDPIGPNVETLRSDVLGIPPARLATLGPYDVVLSDMAPHTSGDRATDQIRSFELFAAALDLAAALLAPGGSFVGKIFMGGAFDEARARVGAHFSTVRVLRPESTRAVSKEIFLVGLGFRPAGR
ncbi:MAG: RlmE family RNA methyltransferase [Deltaproteobacteria bacterium]|nr:RlmE family RNA methyltransferase [Deltaproteobacteria bacterium]